MKKEGKVMFKTSKQLKIRSPIGQVPPDDEDLQTTIKAMLPTASVSEIFAEVSKWEDKAVLKDRRIERTQKSGKLTISCQ